MSADAADDAEVVARVALSRVAEPGDEAMGDWVATVGAVEAVAAIRRGSCPLRRADGYLARASAAPEAQADLDRARALGLRVVVPGTVDWPTQLDDLGARRPMLLWLRGPADLRLSALCSVAVVGARSATAYGEWVTTELAADLAAQGWTVVSGGAYGIDAAAHRGALAVDGVTVAVLANGADTFYPRTNDALLARVADTGLVISELPPGDRPTRPRFLERNRVVAALTRGTVVVEAARRSGALSTAARANALGRPVMAVPGPITSPVAVGTHQLIRDQEAVLVTGSGDVLELVGRLSDQDDDPGGAPAAGGSPGGDDRPVDGLDVDLLAVHEALAAVRPRTVTDVAVRAGLAEQEVLGLLADLRVRGLAERVEGGWRARRARAGRD